MIKKTKLAWGGLFNSGLLIAILTIVIHQYYFKSNKQVEGRIELRKEFVKENYSLYNKMLFWTNMNTQWNLTIAVNNKLDLWSKKHDTLELDSTQHFPITLTLEGVPFLSLLVDSSMQNLWNQYTSDIEKSKFKIEPDILADYNKILKCINEMRSKNDSALTTLKKLGWTEGDAFNKWMDMNVELRKKIRTYTNLE